MNQSSERSRVLVLMGGPGEEHDISLQTGGEIARALRQTDEYEVFDVVIDQPTLDELALIIEAHQADVVFPALHGRWGEGGELQELLEEIGVTYIGSRPRPAMLAMDKIATKAILSAERIPTPPSRQLLPEDECDLPTPLVLKPVDEGSSVDMRICHTIEDVQQARKDLHPKHHRLLAEQYIHGRELTVGILGGEALPILEIIPAVEFYDYEAKYERVDTQYIVNPDLPEGIAQQCKNNALLAYRKLGCRDLARVDFMLDHRGPWILEVNTMPGFTTHSLVPMAAQSLGRDMPQICAELVETALARADISPSPMHPASP
ncbi:MAG: D-alanine--D-alanine ligase [Planctomycetota bacterium]|nr:D-alanine--D-alanine ligase [Planctomycetota bacterium]